MRPPSARIPQRWQPRIARAMQVILVGMFVWGLYTGEPKTIVNSAVGLAITFLPAALERNYRLPLDPFLALWVTAAVFFHTLGSAGLYEAIHWWDHLTHALSASIVAAIGYITVRAIDIHHDDIYLPRRFFVVFVVLFVLAFGVLWELFEYGLDELSAATGLEMPLAQFGLDDTVKDLMYNTLGALIVGIWGHAYLSAVGERVLDSRTAD